MEALEEGDGLEDLAPGAAEAVAVGGGDGDERADGGDVLGAQLVAAAEARALAERGDERRALRVHPEHGRDVHRRAEAREARLDDARRIVLLEQHRQRDRRRAPDALKDRLHDARLARVVERRPLAPPRAHLPHRRVHPPARLRLKPRPALPRAQKLRPARFPCCGGSCTAPCVEQLKLARRNAVVHRTQVLLVQPQTQVLVDHLHPLRKRQLVLHLRVVQVRRQHDDRKRQLVHCVCICKLCLSFAAAAAAVAPTPTFVAFAVTLIALEITTAKVFHDAVDDLALAGEEEGAEEGAEGLVELHARKFEAVDVLAQHGLVELLAAAEEVAERALVEAVETAQRVRERRGRVVAHAKLPHARHGLLRVKHPLGLHILDPLLLLFHLLESCHFWVFPLVSVCPKRRGQRSIFHRGRCDCRRSRWCDASLLLL